jgi:transposase
MRPSVGGALRRRQAGQSEAVKEIVWKAQHRLNATYRRMLGRGKPSQKVITAVGRELVGFIWAIAVEVEQAHVTHSTRPSAAA